MREGVLPGGATALVHAVKGIEAALDPAEDLDERTGLFVVAEAMTAPLRALASSAGLDAGYVVESVRTAEAGQGVDVETGRVRDLAEAGVMDFTGVLCGALESAAYIAKRVLGTEVLVVQPIYAGKYLGTAAEGGPANLSMP